MTTNTDPAAKIRQRAPSNRSAFGDRLRALRLARNINMPAMARALGVSKSSITNWETGVSYPNQPLVPRICDLLGVTPNALYGFADHQSDLPEPERRALRLYRRLTPRDRRSVDALMQAMLESEEEAYREECRRAWHARPRFIDRVCAGSGLDLPSDGASETVFLADMPETRGADAIVTVSGDSMEPTYHDGQELLLHYQPTLLPGQIGIFVVGGEGTVKEFREDGLHPHNPAYGIIRPEEGAPIRCVGRVLGAVTPSMQPDRARRAVLSELYAAGELR